MDAPLSQILDTLLSIYLYTHDGTTI